MKYVRCNVPSADLHVLALCHQAMFSLCMVESEADEVTLQGVTSVGLKHALDFAYTGQVSLSHREQIDKKQNKTTTTFAEMEMLSTENLMKRNLSTPQRNF